MENGFRFPAPRHGNRGSLSRERRASAVWQNGGSRGFSSLNVGTERMRKFTHGRLLLPFASEKDRKRLELSMLLVSKVLYNEVLCK